MQRRPLVHLPLLLSSDWIVSGPSQINKYFEMAYPFQTSYFKGSFGKSNENKGVLHSCGFTISGSFFYESLTQFQIGSAEVEVEQQITDNPLLLRSTNDFGTPRWRGTDSTTTKIWSTFWHQSVADFDLKRLSV